MPLITLDIVIEDARWERVPQLKTRLRKAAGSIADYLPKNLSIPCRVTVLLTDDAAVRKLNRNFRGFDAATNVLSFSQFELRKLPKKGKNREVVELGDLALGYQYIVAEAKKYNKILINHVTHLLIHGILHLFGYDHSLGAAADRMEKLEKRIMAGLKLPDPYAPQPREPKAR